MSYPRVDKKYKTQIEKEHTFKFLEVLHVIAHYPTESDDKTRKENIWEKIEENLNMVQHDMKDNYIQGQVMFKDQMQPYIHDLIRSIQDFGATEAYDAGVKFLQAHDFKAPINRLIGSNITELKKIDSKSLPIDVDVGIIYAKFIMKEETLWGKMTKNFRVHPPYYIAQGIIATCGLLRSSYVCWLQENTCLPEDASCYSPNGESRIYYNWDDDTNGDR